MRQRPGREACLFKNSRKCMQAERNSKGVLKVSRQEMVHPDVPKEAGVSQVPWGIAGHSEKFAFYSKGDREVIKDLTYLIMFLDDPSCCSVGNGLEKDNSRRTITVILGDTTAAWTRLVAVKVEGSGDFQVHAVKTERPGEICIRSVDFTTSVSPF